VRPPLLNIRLAEMLGCHSDIFDAIEDKVREEYFLFRSIERFFTSLRFVQNDNYRAKPRVMGLAMPHGKPAKKTADKRGAKYGVAVRRCRSRAVSQKRIRFFAELITNSVPQ